MNTPDTTAEITATLARIRATTDEALPDYLEATNTHTLRRVARELGVKGAGKLNKADAVDAILTVLAHADDEDREAAGEAAAVAYAEAVITTDGMGIAQLNRRCPRCGELVREDADDEGEQLSDNLANHVCADVQAAAYGDEMGNVRSHLAGDVFPAALLPQPIKTRGSMVGGRMVVETVPADEGMPHPQTDEPWSGDVEAPLATQDIPLAEMLAGALEDLGIVTMTEAEARQANVDDRQAEHDAAEAAEVEAENTDHIIPAEGDEPALVGAREVPGLLDRALPKSLTPEQIQAEMKAAKAAGKAPKATGGTGGRKSWRGRYAEALAEMKRLGGKRGPGIKVTHAELVAHIVAVLAADPQAVSTQEREVAYWLDRLAFSQTRWAAAWIDAEDVARQAVNEGGEAA